MFQFSIIIPSWNNLGHLQLCINSIRKNSAFKNQIIVFVNEGNDGTEAWLKEQHDVDYLSSKKNEGVCVAVNSCRSLVKSPYMIYLNDDMYVCPEWDLELKKEIDRIGHDLFMLSSTAIEPHSVKNPNLVSIVYDFGDNLGNFRETELLQKYRSLQKDDWCGSSWPPSVVSVRLWDIIGGFSIEFSPGMYSDPDFSMKLWQYGVRIFKGVGSSKVYHFQSKSTRRLKKNSGSKTFLLKWGLTARSFYFYYLRMGKSYKYTLDEKAQVPCAIALRNKLKKIYNAFLE